MHRRKKDPLGRAPSPSPVKDPQQKPDPRYLYVHQGMTLDEIAEVYKGVRGYSKRSLTRRSSAEMWKEKRRHHLRSHAAEASASQAAGGAPSPAEPAAAPAPASAPAPAPTSEEDRLASKLSQAKELILDNANLVLTDVRKVLLSDKLRFVAEDDTVVSELKTGMREKEQAMRLHAHAAASVRGLSSENRSPVDVELQRLQREKLAAEVELLRQSIKRAQGGMPEGVLNLVEDDEDSIEKLHERIAALLAASPGKPDA